MLVAASGLVMLACAAACGVRLWYVTRPVAIHPGVWLAWVKKGRGDAVARAVQHDPEATWERELLEALAEPEEETRSGRVNEQLRELDFRLARWERVPRVCASLASSAGFLLGSLTLRFGLLAAVDVPDELRGSAVEAVVLQAINVAAFGVAGTTFAIAAQVRARRAAKAFAREADALVEHLERR